MIQILTDNLLYIISTVFVLVVAGFLYLCVKIKITDVRSRRASQEPKPRAKARMTLYREDGTEVDMTPYIRDVSFGPEFPEPPGWGRRLIGSPDGAVTIEMDTIVTEEDHGEALDRRSEPRDKRSDES